MTDIGENVAVTNPDDPDVCEQEDTHWVEVEYKYQSGTPVEGWCQVTDSSGTEWSTVLNDEGKVCLSGLPPGQVQVSLLPDPDNDQALQATREEIKAVLDGIIADQEAEAAAYEAELERQSGIGQAWTHVTAFGRGLWGGAVGLVEFVGGAAQWAYYLSPLNKLNNALSAAYDSYKAGELSQDEWHQSLAQRMQDEEFSQLAELLGFDVRDLDKEKLQQLQQLLVEAYETAAFIADDAETQQMLEQFAKDFAGAQSSVEWAEFSGGGVFEIVLAALLAAFTGGIGIAAQGASKLRHAAKLKSLGNLFRKLAKLLKRKKMGKKTSADVDASKSETAEMPEGGKPTARENRENNKNARKTTADEDRSHVSSLSDEAAEAEKRGDTELRDQKIGEARSYLREKVLDNSDIPPAQKPAALIERLDVSSPKDKAVFWSGDLGAAKQYANEMGGVTLETTKGGRIADGWDELGDRFPGWQGDPPPNGHDFWSGLSKSYAEGARGDVSVVQSAEKAAQGGGNIWKGTEKPVLEELQDDGLVGKITYQVVGE